MLSVLKKLVPSRQKQERPIECIFSLSPQRRREFLFDLRAILNTPNARLALPNVGNLEATIARNRERIRIPDDAMLVLVRELISVRHKVPEESPLREIMSAIPGLVHTALMEPPAASSLMGGRVAAIRVTSIPGAEQEAEVARIKEMIAEKRKVRPEIQSSLQARAGTADHAASHAASARAENDLRAAALAALASVPAYLPEAPVPAVSGVKGNSRSMSALDQRHFLEASADQIQAIAMSTQELSDEDLSGYVDLCILNGDQDRVIDMLIERVAERPGAWSWARLLELADAARHPQLPDFKQRFHDWAMEHHPHLVPVALADSGSKLFFGLFNEPLRQLERSELGIAGKA